MEWEQPERLSTEPKLSPAAGAFVVGMQRAAAFISRHWLLFINGFFGLLLFGALLAPTLMQAGLQGPGRALYTVYSFTCHQLPERSFFLYGPEGPITTYGQQEVVADGADPTNPLTLRQYIGSEEMGWKLGFSDRMVTMYGGAFLAGIVYWLLSRRGRVKPVPVWLLLLMLIPMSLDGTSHLISEVTGWGFRETNSWAMPLFGARNPEFYTGTTVGTLNWSLRMVTGLLFGLGMMLFAYPLIGFGFDDLADEAERSLARNEAKLAGL
ncbi:MAG TPA: DUF2085 domain-containing protein [Ardenticatenaceae bacterium]